MNGGEIVCTPERPLAGYHWTLLVDELHARANEVSSEANDATDPAERKLRTSLLLEMLRKTITLEEVIAYAIEKADRRVAIWSRSVDRWHRTNPSTKEESQ